MAHFEWDKSDIEYLQPAEVSSLQSAIERLERHYQSRGMVICSFAVNGMRLSEEDEARLSTAPFHDVKTIEVWVESISNLMTMTIENGQKYIDGLIDASTRVSDGMRAGSRNEAFLALQKVTDGLYLLHELSAQMIHLQGFGQAEMVKLQSDLVVVAQTLIQGMTQKDVVALADTLEYDLPETLMNWRNRFTQIKGELANQAHGAAEA